MNKIFNLLLAAGLSISLTACGSDSPIGDLSSALDTFTESSAVTMVRTGTVEACPSSTLGDMATAFMTSPQWSDFVSDTGETVVELEGGISYDGLPATAKFQFIVDETMGTFSTEWLGIDDASQDVFTMSALLGKMCDATF